MPLKQRIRSQSLSIFGPQAPRSTQRVYHPRNAFLYTHVNYAPLGSWGNTGTLDGFVTHFTRKEYGTFQLYSGGDAQKSQVLKGTLLYLNAMTEDCLGIGLPLLFAGMAYAVGERVRYRRETPLTPIASAWVFYLVVFHSLSNLPIDKMRLFLGILTHKRAL